MVPDMPGPGIKNSCFSGVNYNQFNMNLAFMHAFMCVKRWQSRTKNFFQGTHVYHQLPIINYPSSLQQFLKQHNYGVVGKDYVP